MKDIRAMFYRELFNNSERLQVWDQGYESSDCESDNESDDIAGQQEYGDEYYDEENAKEGQEE